MGNIGFYIDATACIGCRTCQIACKDKNRLDAGSLFRRVISCETGQYPDAQIYHYSASCNHCENPACLLSCPTGAIYKEEDGAVLLDSECCTGCGNCVTACPYGHPTLLPDNTAGKCDSCFALRQKGQNPACVDACVMRCLDFGDLDAFTEKYGNDLVNEIPLIGSAEATGAHVLIRTDEYIRSKDYREVMI
jgi:anaerobic dimethyl sulfoxide reductase subunit B (iron-sulfur subunit)